MFRLNGAHRILFPRNFFGCVSFIRLFEIRCLFGYSQPPHLFFGAYYPNRDSVAYDEFDGTETFPFVDAI